MSHVLSKGLSWMLSRNIWCWAKHWIRTLCQSPRGCRRRRRKKRRAWWHGRGLRRCGLRLPGLVRAARTARDLDLGRCGGAGCRSGGRVGGSVDLWLGSRLASRFSRSSGWTCGGRGHRLRGADEGTLPGEAISGRETEKRSVGGVHGLVSNVGGSLAEIRPTIALGGFLGLRRLGSSCGIN